jgi:hypothetical protein
MPFLRINGLTIPVRLESPNVEPLEIGERVRAHSGKLLTDRRARKRIWKGTTPLLTELDAKAVEGAIAGLGDIWPFQVDSFSAKGLGLADASGLVVMDTVAADNDTIDHAVGMTEATQFGTKFVQASTDVDNKLTGNRADGTEDGTTTGFSVLNSATLASQTTHRVSGARGLQVDTTSGATVDGVRTTALSADASSVYIASVYVKPDTISQSIRVRLRDDTNGVEGTSVQALTDNEWLRITVSVTTGGSPVTDLFLAVEDSAAADQQTFYIDQLSIRKATGQASHPFRDSPWLDGIRTVTTPPTFNTGFLSGAAGITINLWANPGADIGSIDYGVSLYGATPSAEYAELFNDASGNYQFQTLKKGSSPDALGFTMTNNFQMITAVMRYNPETGEVGKETYVDGVFDSGVTPADLPPGSGLSTMAVGHKNDTGYGHWFFQDLMVLPFAATGAQIAAWFAMGKAMSSLPRVFVDGDIMPDDTLTVEAEGLVRAGEFAWASARNNRRRVEFELHEV